MARQRARGPVCQKTSAAAVASASTLSAATSLSEIGICRMSSLSALQPSCRVRDRPAEGPASRPGERRPERNGKVRIYRTSAKTAELVQRTAPLRWLSRVRPVRPPARPLRVLDPRRGVPDPGARAEGGRARDARRVAHRPRLDGRRDRPLQGRRRAGDQADLRLRGVRRRRSPRAHEGPRAPDAPRRRQHRLREPDQALLARLPRGLLLQAARRLGAARAPRAGDDRALRLPLRPRLAGALREPRRRRRGRTRPAGADLRPGQHVRRAAERRARRAAGRLPRPPEARRAARPPARRHRRRPLPRSDRRAQPRRASLHSVRRLAQEPEPLALRRRGVLLQDPGRDGARLPRTRGRHAPQPRGRRALQRRARARPDPAAELPRARRPRRVRLPRRAVREGSRQALRRLDPGARRAAALRAQDRPRNGLRGLLPDRRRLHRLREAKRRLGRPGPRLGGRLARRLLPRDHRHRPDALRPPVRAVPEPRPQGHARHGHRLRGRGPGARHQLRHREVRPRPRRADHHLLEDGRPRRAARRRARARDSLRRRRSDREARPGGPGPDARGRAQARDRSSRRRSRATPSRWRSSTSPARSRG